METEILTEISASNSLEVALDAAVKRGDMERIVLGVYVFSIPESFYLGNNDGSTDTHT